MSLYERNLMVGSFKWNLDLQQPLEFVAKFYGVTDLNEGTLIWYRFLFYNSRVSWNEIWDFSWIFIFGTIACNKHWSCIYLKILERLGVVATRYYHEPNLTETFQTFNVTWHWVCWPNTYDVEVPDHSKETSATVLLKRFNVFESVDEILWCDHWNL